MAFVSSGCVLALPSSCATHRNVICMRSAKRRQSSKGQSNRSQKQSGGRVENTSEPAPQAEAAFAEEALPMSRPLPLSDDEETLEITNKAKLRLPDAPAAIVGDSTRRRRRRKQSAVDNDQEVAQDDRDAEVGVDMSPDQQREEEIQKLTEEFRKGNPELSDDLKREIEKDPDFLLQAGKAVGKYDLTAALIGVGKPNKQGIYVLPYLQSGHVLLLLVVLLGAFVYYPGFPLTELDESVAEMLRRGLAATFTVNSFFAVFAYSEAKKRDQPQLFWALKTALLGWLALTELRNNAATAAEMEMTSRKKKKGKKQKKTE